MKFVKVPGSCGELVQGLERGELFLVTCPINLYSTAKSVSYKWRNPYKIAKARRLVLEYFKQDKWLNIKVNSQLLKGKGMASSSADIIATMDLVAWELGKVLSVEELGHLAAEIEPTDGIFCPGIVKYAYRKGEVLENWGMPPKFKILLFDGGGRINTLQFNRQNKVLEHYKQHENEISKALHLVREGIFNKDLLQIGKGATLSGYLNQGLLYKPALEDLIFISERYKALGVNVAHSGTVMGILFAPEMEDEVLDTCKEEVLATCLKLKYIDKVEIISGGIEREEV